MGGKTEGSWCHWAHSCNLILDCFRPPISSSSFLPVSRKENSLHPANDPSGEAPSRGNTCCSREKPRLLLSQHATSALRVICSPQTATNLSGWGTKPLPMGTQLIQGGRRAAHLKTNHWASQSPSNVHALLRGDMQKDGNTARQIDTQLGTSSEFYIENTRQRGLGISRSISSPSGSNGLPSICFCFASLLPAECLGLASLWNSLSEATGKSL